MTVTNNKLVEENDVRFPDFTGHDTNDGDSSKLTWFPAQLIVLP